MHVRAADLKHCCPCTLIKRNNCISSKLVRQVRSKIKTNETILNILFTWSNYGSGDRLVNQSVYLFYSEWPDLVPLVSTIQNSVMQEKTRQKDRERNKKGRQEVKQRRLEGEEITGDERSQAWHGRTVFFFICPVQLVTCHYRWNLSWKWRCQTASKKKKPLHLQQSAQIQKLFGYLSVKQAHFVNVLLASAGTKSACAVLAVKKALLRWSHSHVQVGRPVSNQRETTCEATSLVLPLWRQGPAGGALFRERIVSESANEKTLMRLWVQNKHKGSSSVTPNMSVRISAEEALTFLIS